MLNITDSQISEALENFKHEKGIARFAEFEPTIEILRNNETFNKLLGALAKYELLAGDRGALAVLHLTFLSGVVAARIAQRDQAASVQVPQGVTNFNEGQKAKPRC